MAFQRSAVGIDLGTRTVRVAHLNVSEKGATVLQALEIERRELLADAGDATEIEAIAAALARRMKEARIPQKGVILGLNGQDAVLRYTRTPPVPDWRLKVIMNYEVNEFAERIGESLATDYRRLQLPRELDEDQTILIAQAKESILEQLLSAFEGVGITVEKAVPSALAVFTTIDALGEKSDPDSPDDDFALYLEVGAKNTNLVFVLNDRLVFARSVTFGGDQFTEAIASATGASLPQAEKLKVSRGGLAERRGIVADTVPPLRAQSGQLLSAVQSSLRFCSKQTGVDLPPLSRIYLLGGAGRLRGLRAFLQQSLKAKTEFFRPQTLRVGDAVEAELSQDLEERTGNFGVCLGLGIAGLRVASGDEGPSSIVILPDSYKKRREFRERTLFLYLAAGMAALLLLAQGVFGFYQNYKADAVRGGLKKQLSQLQQHQQEMEQNTLFAEEGRSRLNLLLREAEQTAFQAFVLDFLGRNLRPEIQLESIEWIAQESEARDAEANYALSVRGRVNNEKRKALEWLLELQSQLLAEEPIALVEEGNSRPDEAWYVFDVTLHPNYIRY